MTSFAGLALGCARPAALSTPGRRAVDWEVTVAVASGERTLTALYELRTEPSGDGVWIVHTRRSRGTWEEDGVEHVYDSAEPAASDPWPLTLQHLVASVPAAVRLGPDGVPLALADPRGWKADARRVLYASELPVDALASGDALLDEEGLLADLRRTFPGVPSAGSWSREERVAGVAAERREICEEQRAQGVWVWDCEGEVVAPEGALARLHAVDSWTHVECDRRGLVRVEGTYSGTLVLPDLRGGALDRPIAGRRLVERL